MTSSPSGYLTSRYMVVENQFPAASFLGSHRGSSFFFSSWSSPLLAPFLRMYFTFLKMIHSIVLWSTCLNLLGVVAYRSMTVLLPRLFSTLTRWHIIVQSSPSVSCFAIFAASFLTPAKLTAFSLSVALSTVGYLWKHTVNTVSEKVSSNSAREVMVIGTSLAKWSALGHFSRISFDTVLLSPF